jgi:glycosyltransferase involved in cell wall biosynthesis
LTRVLLVCPEPLGHGRPAGIGIRFLEMANVLTAGGHSVTLLSPDAANIDRCGARSDGITPESLLRYSGEADVAVVQGHMANDFFAHARPIPTVVDLYDPFIIENLHYHASRGSEVFTHDHATLVNSLMRGDTFLCASEAQRLFYIGLLLAVGRVNPPLFESDPRLETLVRIAPFGVPPPRNVARALSSRTPAGVPAPRSAGVPAPRSAGVPGPRSAVPAPNILFGGIYDWYDPILAIDAVNIARHSFPNLTLTFNTHPNPELTPQRKLAAAMKHAKRFDFVRFEPWVPYDERGAYFDRFALGLLTFRQSLETDLSMRTRLYDYLWGGLPVVSSSAPGTDELLTRYDAGIVVRSESPRDVADAILRALGAPMHEGARRFTLDHQWSRTLAPLLDFVQEPRFDAHKETFAVQPEVAGQPRSILQRIKRRIGGAP